MSKETDGEGHAGRQATESKRGEQRDKHRERKTQKKEREKTSARTGFVLRPCLLTWHIPSSCHPSLLVVGANHIEDPSNLRYVYENDAGFAALPSFGVIPAQVSHL